MIAKPTNKKNHIILGAAAVCVFVLFYSLLSWRQHAINPTDSTIPNLGQFVEGFKKITATNARGEVWIVEDLKATGERLFAGLSLGVVGSLIVGMTMGCLSPVAAFLVPPLTFISKIPATAMMALYLVLFGTDFELFVAVIALGILPSLALGIYATITKDVHAEQINKAYTLGASHMEVVTGVVWPQILPRFLQAVQLHIGPAMVFLIAVEWMMTDVGFGYRLRMQSRLLNMNVVYLYLALLGLIGWAFDWSLVQARRKLSPWFGE